jgi:hypothetical protein
MTCYCGVKLNKGRTFCNLKCQKDYMARGFSAGHDKRKWRLKHEGIGSFENDNRPTGTKGIEQVRTDS